MVTCSEGNLWRPVKINYSNSRHSTALSWPRALCTSSSLLVSFRVVRIKTQKFKPHKRGAEQNPQNQRSIVRFVPKRASMRPDRSQKKSLIILKNILLKKEYERKKMKNGSKENDRFRRSRKIF